MTQEQKVELIRKNVILAVEKYKNELVGKRFLYIFGDEFIEVIYKIENFMHLTGVDSKKLKPKKFYERAKDSTLKRSHMFFSSRNPLKTALEKSNELSRIDIFSNSKIYIVKDMLTGTYTYSFCFSDKKMTLGLTKDTGKDADGEIELNYYIPKTFRVKEDATKHKYIGEVVENTMILSKTDVEAKYNKIHYGSEKQIELLSNEIKEYIDESLKGTVSNNDLKQLKECIKGIEQVAVEETLQN